MDAGESGQEAVFWKIPPARCDAGTRGMRLDGRTTAAGSRKGGAELKLSGVCCSVSLAAWRCGAGGGGWNPGRDLVARSWRSHSWRPEEDQSRDMESLSQLASLHTIVTFIGKCRGRWRCGANLPPRTLRTVNGVDISLMTGAWFVVMGAELKTTAKRAPGSRACGRRAEESGGGGSAGLPNQHKAGETQVDWRAWGDW